MNVYVYPADQTGCGYYRLIWPAQALKQAGVNITIVTKADEVNQFQARMHGDRISDVIIPEDADVMVFQRPMHKVLAQAISVIREKKNVAVVVDVDDDLTAIDPQHPAFALMYPRQGVDHSWQNVRVACDSATMVTVSTPALLDVYARKARGQVLFNYVPRYFTEHPHEDSPFVGWGGAVFSHPDDLQTMGPAISRIIREFGTFRLVGPGDGLAQALGGTVAEKVDVVGKVEFLDWYRGIGDNLGIGVAPTADTRFNAAKSWLKPLEYAAVGVVPVSSPRAEYTRLQREYGIGYTARSPKEWFRQVKDLVTHEGLRRELSGSWRAIVAEHLTIEDNAGFWFDAWSEALRIQREQPVRAA